MISCCAHYLANIMPAVGAAGIITLVAQYQIQLFWFGLASNAVEENQMKLTIGVMGLTLSFRERSPMSIQEVISCFHK